jgi:hypothetical protein
MAKLALSKSSFSTDLGGRYYSVQWTKVTKQFRSMAGSRKHPDTIILILASPQRQEEVETIQ